MAASQPMTPDVARDVILRSAHSGAFFDKLASFGIVPQNEDEAQSLLDLGFKVAALEAQQPRAASGNRFAKVANVVNHALGKTSAYEYDSALEKAAALAQNPTIYSAALAIRQAQAAALDNQAE